MEIIEIANKIKNIGGELYLVGGAVRDKLLGIENSDEDYCVVGLSEEEFLSLFPNAIPRGKSFKVFDIDNKEFALARKDKKTGTGHKEFEIIVDKNITIQDDLSRRDITINAIAKNVVTNKIIDPFNGIKDLENKKIRAINENFKDDPLRVYRVARFASTLNFDVDEYTLRLMEKQKEELKTLSKERVFVEFRKALNSNKPSIFFEVLKKANVLDVHFKEIFNLIDKTQPEKYHPEGDSFNHTMLTVDNSAKLTNDEKIRFCALVHDLGKGLTPKEMLPHHYGHEERGIELLKKLSNRIGIPNIWTRCAKTAILEHMRGGIFYKMRKEKQVAFIERVGKSVLGLDGLEIVVKSDRNRLSEKTEKIDFAIIGNKMLEEINGEYIIKKYGNVTGNKFAELLTKERINWINNK